ncbi:MAG: prepilin-type N-terminal cleavage/methylation domain-containing protein [Candidatus Saccharibacteria bacterium]
MRRIKNNGAAGFTIVEVLVAIAVGAIMVASLNQVVVTYLHVGQRGRYLNLANAYVEAKTEALRNSGYNRLNNGSTNLKAELPTQLPPSRNATLTVADQAAGLKKVDISISYNDQGQPNIFNYTTYIGELGVGQ